MCKEQDRKVYMRESLWNKGMCTLTILSMKVCQKRTWKIEGKDKFILAKRFYRMTYLPERVKEKHRKRSYIYWCTPPNGHNGWGTAGKRQKPVASSSSIRRVQGPKC